MTSNDVESIILGAWILLAPSGVILFYFTRYAALKRRVFPWYVCLAAVSFLGLIAAAGASVTLLVVLAPVVALLTFLNATRTRFCDACGRTVSNHLTFGRPHACCKCGASLDTRDQTPPATSGPTKRCS